MTKKGRDAEGLDATLGRGNFGQTRYSAVYGRAFDEGDDLLLWGASYEADGEEISISPDEDYSSDPAGGAAIVDGIKDPSSYDAGLRYSRGPWSLLAGARYCKYIEPFSAGGVTGETYKYGQYREFMGTGPGLGSTFRHFNLSYEKTLKSDIDVNMSVYRDFNRIDVALIIDPSIQKIGIPQWTESDMGFMGHVRKHYEWNGVGSGNLLVGVQYDGMKLTDSMFPLGTGGEYTSIADNSDVRVLETGEEEIYSAFSQLKQRIRNQYIFNLGVRYDNKNRHDGPRIGNFSPRLAAIYLPNARFNVKLSYSQSFVDAPYWYRYNSLASYRGARDLEPEHLTSVQFTPTIALKGGRITNLLNFFYNDLTHFIYRDNNAAPTEPIYRNAGDASVREGRPSAGSSS
ncbi:MAG: TonB-dependent receptor [Candidatus Eisenbacteria bacterium]